MGKKGEEYEVPKPFPKSLLSIIPYGGTPCITYEPKKLNDCEKVDFKFRIWRNMFTSSSHHPPPTSISDDADLLLIDSLASFNYFRL